MKIVIAIDSLKGCLSSAEAGRAATEGIMSRWPEAEVVCLPVSDGGEGWLEAVRNVKCGVGNEPWETVTTMVSDPLLRPVQAKYLLAGETAVIEIAEACGLHLLQPEERDPLRASSRGVGELLLDAAQRGARKLMIGLGGSAVSDNGRGMMEAVLMKSEASCYSSPFTRHSSFHVTIATDVENPLYGSSGAAAVFGPQKGATPSMVQQLDHRARIFAEENARQMGFDRSGEVGAGAAGGLGYAFMQFFDAKRRSGAGLLLDLLHFDELIRDADFIITGEGRADRQTLLGKLPTVILRHALRAGVPCHLIAGDVQDRESLLAAGFASVCGITPPNMALQEALRPEVARQNILQTLQVIRQ